jgi:hypothetical protein
MDFRAETADKRGMPAAVVGLEGLDQGLEGNHNMLAIVVADTQTPTAEQYLAAAIVLVVQAI